MSHRHRGRILPVLILSVQSVPLINKVMNAITSHLPIRRTLGMTNIDICAEIVQMPHMFYSSNREKKSSCFSTVWKD
jgi:hypothetical protein